MTNIINHAKQLLLLALCIASNGSGAVAQSPAFDNPDLLGGNGDFESVMIEGPGAPVWFECTAALNPDCALPADVSGTDPNRLPGWTVTEKAIDAYTDGEHGPANTGTYFIDMCGNRDNNGGAIETSITTVTGRWYRINFVGQPHSSCIGVTQTASTRVTVTDTTSSTVITSTAFSAPGNSRGWAPHELMFQAAGSSTAIEFKDVTAPEEQCAEKWGCMLIDSVTVVGEILTAEDCSGSSGSDSSSMSMSKSDSSSMSMSKSDSSDDRRERRSVNTHTLPASVVTSSTVVIVAAMTATVIAVAAMAAKSKLASRSESPVEVTAVSVDAM